MKTLKTSIFASVALVIVSLAACNKNNNSATPTVASGSSKLSFQMQAVNAAPDSIIKDTITGLTWTAGTANIGWFAFEAKRKGVSINIQSSNLINVDLFALTPLQTYITLDTGTYQQIEIIANLQSTDSIPPLKLTGSFKNDSSKTVPIEFDLSGNTIVKVVQKNIDINGTTDYTALLALQLDRVTKGITAADLNKAKLTNGAIIISKTSNTLLYLKMKSNISICGWGAFREHRRF